MVRHAQRDSDENPFLRLVPKLTAPMVMLPMWQEAVDAYVDLVQARMDAEFALYRQRMTVWLRLMGSLNTAVQEADDEH